MQASACCNFTSCCNLGHGRGRREVTVTVGRPVCLGCRGLWTRHFISDNGNQLTVLKLLTIQISTQNRCELRTPEPHPGLKDWQLAPGLLEVRGRPGDHSAQNDNKGSRRVKQGYCKIQESGVRTLWSCPLQKVGTTGMMILCSSLFDKLQGQGCGASCLSFWQGSGICAGSMEGQASHMSKNFTDIFEMYSE